MKALVKFLSLILVLAFAFACTPDTTHDVVLDSDWQFKHPDSSEWLAAQIPGSVHMDLLHHGLIDDPFYGSNEKALTWVGTSDWEYKTSFSGQGLRGREHAQLVFEGLDTYADVYLNDSLVLHADNMFRTWRVNIRHLVRPDRNDLYIRFYAPRQIEKDKGNRAGYKLPQLRAFTRKAPYHYGWD